MTKDLVGDTTKVPRHQLRDDLKVGDNVNANGFYFEAISVGEEWVVLECLEDLIEYHKKYDEDIGLAARLEALDPWPCRFVEMPF